MNERNTHTNRMWWVASIAVLLFASLAVLPVAAIEWPSNNDTFIAPANGMRTLGDNSGTPGNFSYDGNPLYYFQMNNGTAGMNAIHITDNTSIPSGGQYSVSAKSGTFYVSSTGGHTGEDNVLLLVSVYSPEESDVANFQMSVTASGYNWVPLPGANAPFLGSPSNKSSYNTSYYNASTLSRTFTASDYLEQSGTDVIQKWKFAPSANYPTYYGQVMTGTPTFKMILIDLNAGAISNRFTNYQYLNDKGMVKITYNITSDLAEGAIVAFNTNVFNSDAPGWKNSVRWINPTSGSTPSGYVVAV